MRGKKEAGNRLKQIQYERATVNRLRLHVLPTKQFKTFAISLLIGQPLREETVTSCALIPFVLRRGNRRFPETKKFREHLDNLYGAGFGFDVYKRGDYQIIQFRMDVIHDRFVANNGVSLLEEGLQLLGETLTDPALEGGVFRHNYVDDEKETLRKRIEAIINDKIRYAAERCLEEMCKNEPYRLHPLGKIGDLPEITPQNLYSSYQRWLAEAPIDLYVVGDTSMDEVTSLVNRHFRLERAANASYAPPVLPAISSDAPKNVIEALEVNQGKLNLGLRTRSTYADEAYPALLAYNGILGGYAHSKLFVNVREKASLAYYASSRLDGHKGILTIQSGIEIENYEKALRIIREQLDAMAAGEISELELSQTKAMIKNQLQEIQDSAFELISFDFNGILSGFERTVADLIARIERMERSDVQAAAKQVTLDTIYFLRNKEGEQHA
jgi:predicted Zn-dependent peptidase